jgi:formylglycine-generating enzyme required for sulfatase activity
MNATQNQLFPTRNAPKKVWRVKSQFSARQREGKTAMFARQMSAKGIYTLAKVFITGLSAGLWCAGSLRADTPINAYLSLASNSVQVLWLATPSNVYVLKTTTNLAQPWQVAPGQPPTLTATSNRLAVTLPINAAARFFTVVQLTAPPPFPPEMVWIPPGTFVMGSPASEAERYSDETQHTVTLSQGFYMGKYLVTQADYLAVVGNNPSYFTTRDWNGNPIPVDLNRPVEQVSWYDATNYCGRLTQQEQAAGRLPAGWVYRLPTEAEWEYACRAGTTTAFYCGSALLSGMANFDGQYGYDASVGDIYNANGIYLDRTAAVGSYQPNAWGLYDMAGNVWEWCMDWYGAYAAGSVTDPTGPPSGSYRVGRGGSWYYYAGYCRSAFRDFDFNPPDGYDYLGFRVVLAPGQP